jgi:hypothetical protein
MMTNFNESGQQIRNRMVTAPKTSEQPLTRQRKMPELICHECGTKYCNGLVKDYAEYYIDTCQCCGAEEVPCTAPRHYNHFKQWPLPYDIDPKPLPRTLEDLVQPVLDEFDFEKVHKVMTAIRWQWFDGEGPDHVPTVDQLKKKARELLESVIGLKYNSNITGTGGLWTKRYLEDDPNDEGIKLQFILESCEMYLGDYK